MLHAIGQFLYDWQTILAGMLALLGAIITVRVIRTQIGEERKRNDEERERYGDALHRKGLAARAQMPDALSALSQFTEACVLWAKRGSPTFPALPTDAINALKIALEFVDSEAANTLFRLVSFYQVHNARLVGCSPPIHGIEAADRLYDMTRLRALVDQMFPYARNEVQNAPSAEPSRAEMTTALKIIVSLPLRGDYADQYDRVKAYIETRHKD